MTIDACVTKSQKDSILDYAIERSTIKSFAISGLKFDIKSKNPMTMGPCQLLIQFLIQ